MQSGQLDNIHFSGFTDVLALSFNNTALITEITGFTSDDSIAGTWQSYSHESIFLGVYDAGVKVIIHKGKPIKLPYTYQPPQPGIQNNVVSIMTATQE